VAGGAPRVLAVLGVGPGVVADGAPGLDPLDLALVRGEAVFETVRVYAGRPFRLGAHLERLARSAAAIELELPGGLEALAARAVAAAGGGELEERAIAAGSDLRQYAAAGIPTLHYGPGDLRLAHGPRERVPITDVVLAARAFALLALRTAGAR
jgi:acetylornithine deacetylase